MGQTGICNTFADQISIQTEIQVSLPGEHTTKTAPKRIGYYTFAAASSLTAQAQKLDVDQPAEIQESGGEELG